jgi:CRP/FNR family transcriptional regulator, polysaccharide utilization system transcription regulator
MKKNSKGLVLLIEDDPDVRRFASLVLELEEYSVLQAENGEIGLELARRNDCELVLLDLRLSGLDGWTVLKELKEDPNLSNIPVFVFSASADLMFREKAMRLGAADYLLKPLSAASLRDAVARATKCNERIMGWS